MEYPFRSRAEKFGDNIVHLTTLTRFGRLTNLLDGSFIEDQDYHP